MLKTILFDLDGTLLGMDEEKFTLAYFNLLADKMSKYGYDPKLLVKMIYEGLVAMVSNDGNKTNEEVFWQVARKYFKDKIVEDKYLFDEFYLNDFNSLSNTCKPIPHAQELIKYLKQNDFEIILATNPIFPEAATKQRIKWSNLDINDFKLITTYENSSFCKPNRKYYEEIIKKTNINPSKSIMIGNDLLEDGISKDLGFDVYIVEDYLINKKNLNINEYKHGSFIQMIDYLKKLSAR